MVLGFQQIESAALASAVALTIPAGTERAWIQAESANVRYRTDGENPTAAIGMLVVSTATQPLELSIAAGLRDAKFIAATGTPKLNVTYFGSDAP